jgi:hypothetical protein
VRKKSSKRRRRSFHAKSSSAFYFALYVFLLFYPAIQYGTVYYDDSDYVGMDNPYVEKGLSQDGIIWAFTTGHAANWHRDADMKEN